MEIYLGGTGASGEKQGTQCSGWGRAWDGFYVAEFVRNLSRNAGLIKVVSLYFAASLGFPHSDPGF